jgi:hypothetical protein
MSHATTKRYRAWSLGVNGSSRPGRDSQPFGVGLLIGAVISAALWAAIGAAMFFPSGATKIDSLLVALGWRQGAKMQTFWCSVGI